MIARLLGRSRKSRATEGLAPQRRAIFPPKQPELLRDAAAAQRRAIFEAARNLPDGACCDAPILGAIRDEALARRRASGTAEGPDVPNYTDLRVRHDGVPDWWRQGGNVAFAAPDGGPKELTFEFMEAPPTNLVVVFGARSSFQLLRFIGDDGAVFIGDDVNLVHSVIVVGADTTVMIGEETNATWMCSIDARNGATVVFGADSMLASGVWIVTDDTHAIRDATNDARINLYGGRIVVDRHVWLCDQVRMSGDCFVGRDAVIGVGALVKNVSLPANAVSVGRPARPVRTGVTWTRADLP